MGMEIFSILIQLLIFGLKFMTFFWKYWSKQ